MTESEMTNPNPEMNGQATQPAPNQVSTPPVPGGTTTVDLPGTVQGGPAQPTPAVNRDGDVRLITEHAVNPANEKLVIEVLDQPGPGGACHHYRISGYQAEVFGTPDQKVDCVLELMFQNGPIAEVGVNGITHEALLAILIDRMQGFQSGPFACSENGLALKYLSEAQRWLKQRTVRRMSQGVEGTHQGA